MDEQRLLELKQEIDEAKTKVSELTGQKNALMKQLKEEYGCKTIQDADNKVDDLEKQIDDLNSQIEQGIEELETKYDFE